MSNVFNEIKNLCKTGDITISRLEKEIGLGNGSIYKWDKSLPSADRLAKVADYFKVSVDSLLGREKDFEKDGEGVSEIKVIRNDRGLDFRRIEQFIKMFQQKCQNKSYVIDRQKKGIEEKRKAEAFEHFGLTTEIEAIKAIETQIETLKKQQRAHEEKVRDFTQGQKERYNSYDSIREKSPIQDFINEGLESIQIKRDEVWSLNQKLSNELWYARDLEQAIEIVQKFEGMLDEISL